MKSIRPFLADQASLILLGIGAPLLLIPNPFWVAGALLVTLQIIQALVSGLQQGPNNRSQYSWLPDLSMLLLLFMGMVGLLTSENSTISLPKLQGLLCATGAYFAVSRYVLDFHRATKVATLLTAACLGIALFGLIGTEWLSGYSKTATFARVYELLPRLTIDIPASHGMTAGLNPNEVAGVLGSLLPIAAGTLFVSLSRNFQPARWRNARMALASVSMVLGSAYVLLSVSRTAWLSLGLAFSAMLATTLIRRSAAFLLPLAAMVAITTFAVWELHDRHTISFFSDSDLTWEQGESAWGRPMRPQIWQRSLRMILDHPVTGIGLNMFPYVVQTRYPFEQFNDQFVPHAHNWYLQTALDYGLPGLLSVLALVSLAIVGAIRSLKARSIPSGLALGILGAILAILSFGMLDAVAVGAKPSFLFFSIFALGIALGRIGKRSI